MVFLTNFLNHPTNCQDFLIVVNIMFILLYFLVYDYEDIFSVEFGLAMSFYVEIYFFLFLVGVWTLFNIALDLEELGSNGYHF